MKADHLIKARSLLLIITSLMFLQCTQIDSTLATVNLGKGTIYLKQHGTVQNILIREFKSFWIEYEKEGSLHNRTMDEIERIEFPGAKPVPVILIFDKHKPLLKKMEIY